MGMKRWDHRPGTCRALIWALGKHVVVCHWCKRTVPLPAIDVPFDPCPFVCQTCGTRGEIKDPADVPSDYRAEERVYVPPKLRWKPSR